MKTLIKRGIRSTVAALPSSLRNAIFDAANEHDLWLLLTRKAKEIGIESVSADGELGLIEGFVDDQYLFRKYLRHGGYGRSTVDLFSQALKQGGTFIDIGANIGLIAIPVLRNGASRALLIEAAPDTYRLLERNIATAGVADRCKTVNAAVFDRHSEIVLKSNRGNPGGRKLVPGGLPPDETGDVVPCLPLDDIEFEPEGTVAIKMDVEGAEPFVIAGGRGTFQRADLVVLEYSPLMIQKMGGAVEEILTLARQFPHASIYSSESYDEQALEWQTGEAIAAKLMADYELNLRNPGPLQYDVVLSRLPR